MVADRDRLRASVMISNARGRDEGRHHRLSSRARQLRPGLCMRCVAALVAGLMLTACAHRGAPRDCTGTPIATVRNNWHRSVDVYAEIDGRSDWVLGEVASGDRREFTLPTGTTRLIYRWRGPYVGPPPTSADISVSYMCG